KLKHQGVMNLESNLNHIPSNPEPTAMEFLFINLPFDVHPTLVNYVTHGTLWNPCLSFIQGCLVNPPQEPPPKTKLVLDIPATVNLFLSPLMPVLDFRVKGKPRLYKIL